MIRLCIIPSASEAVNPDVMTLNLESGIWKAESGNAVILLTAVRSTDRMNVDSSKKAYAARPVDPVNHSKEETAMDNKAMEANRPMDQEELLPEQSEQVTGGFQDNTTNTNTASFINTASFNTANINTANINIPLQR